MVAHGEAASAAPAGEWNTEQILAHVSLVTAVTLTSVAAVSSGANATFDNRIALDTWTIDRTVTRAGGHTGLHQRIRLQGHALCALAGSATPAELDTPVPALLLSGDTVLVDQIVPLGGLLTGLSETEIPGHTAQLRTLLPAETAATTPTASAAAGRGQEIRL